MRNILDTDSSPEVAYRPGLQPSRGSNMQVQKFRETRQACNEQAIACEEVVVSGHEKGKFRAASMPGCTSLTSLGRDAHCRFWVESRLSIRLPHTSSTQTHPLQPGPAAHFSPLPARSRQITSNRYPHQNATFTPTVILRPINGAAFLMKLVCAYANRSVRFLAFR